MTVNVEERGQKPRARLADCWLTGTDAPGRGGMPAMPMPPRPAGPAGLSRDRSTKRGEVIVGHRLSGSAMVVHDIGDLCDECEIF
jgi:hypothetical protein